MKIIINNDKITLKLHKISDKVLSMQKVGNRFDLDFYIMQVRGTTTTIVSSLFKMNDQYAPDSFYIVILRRIFIVKEFTNEN